jgi:type I restriction-modification system DNA methylase subunit
MAKLTKAQRKAGLVVSGPEGEMYDLAIANPPFGKVYRM